jgi:four helix bundle protein
MSQESRLARTFEELEVYQRSRILAQHVFELSKSFPKSEMFSLTDQLRRSSRSIGAQIAEAWAKRRYPKHFLSKLTDADAEQMETHHWIGVAASCGYLRENASKDLLDEVDAIGRMLNSMIGKASEFCDLKARSSS